MASFTPQMFAFHFLFLLQLVYSTGGLTYECQPDKNEKVKIIIDRTDTEIAGCSMQYVPTGCKDATNDKSFILTECPKDTNIVVEFAKIGIDKVLKKANEHIFTLRCERKDDLAYQIVTVDPFDITEPTALPPSVHTFKKTDWIPTLSMTVSPNTNVYIGQHITLTITSSDSKYRFAAQSCTATSGSSNSHTLWDNSDCSKGDNDLFETSTPWAFNNETGTPVLSHTLEAFRFSTSNNLALECSVVICPSGRESTCQDALKCQSVKTGRRRRRDVNSRTTVVKTNIHVDDFLQDYSNSGSGSNLATSSLIGVAVVIYKALLH